MDVPRPGKPTVLADRDDDLGNRRRRYGDDDDRPRRNSDEDDNYVVRRRRKRGRTCECPNCGYEGVPYTRKEMAPEGLILLIVMLFVFFPLFFLGLLMKQEYELCEECGFKIRKVGGVTFG
jgi:DNA-directed RNA polymerase subunit RPC12/RpoP